jgi:hypothetical protein
MSHPQNKYERILISKKKGRRRVIFLEPTQKNDPVLPYLEKCARYRRNTTTPDHPSNNPRIWGEKTRQEMRNSSLAY